MKMCYNYKNTTDSVYGHIKPHIITDKNKSSINYL